MNQEWTNERWEDAIRHVFRRALLDPQFRKRALADPRAAFAEACGTPPPDALKLRFVEQLDEHVLVLPQVITGPNALSEIDISRILHHAVRQQSIPPSFAPAPPC